MFTMLILGLCVGLLVGGSIVFATISWITNHVATVENNLGKFAVIQTSRVLFSFKVK
jgi:hypothetical protein